MYFQAYHQTVPMSRMTRGDCLLGMLKQASEDGAQESKVECENLTSMLEDASAENDSITQQLKALQEQFESSQKEFQALASSPQVSAPPPSKPNFE